MLNAALAEIGEEQLYFATPQAAADYSRTGVADPEDDLQTRCSAIYPQVRAKLLNAYPWSWLAQRVQLVEVPAAQGEATGAWPWAHRYEMPVQHIASIRGLYDDSMQVSAGSGPRLNEAPPRVEGWSVFGPYIYAGFNPAWAHIQGDVAEEAWPDLFENAMTMELTARLSLSIKEDLPTTRYYDQLAELALANAKRVDAQSQPNVAVRRFDWEEVRFQGQASRYRI